MSAVDARLVKHFPAVKNSPAFELNVHLQSAQGICLISGPSGAGKTILLNCLGGFMRPDHGRITVNDEILFDAASRLFLPPERRRCGYIFQDHALFPHLTIKDNVRFAASRWGSRRNQYKKVIELLDAFGLADLAERKPAQLSGGQKQRAALARILASDPHLLLLDEPSRGMDATLRATFYELLRGLRDRLRIPILLVSHDLAEAIEIADSICLLAGGRVIQSGSSSEVLHHPISTEAADLVGLYAVLPATIRSLNPTENTSSLHILNCEIEGPYFKGHLNGDGGFLCLLKSAVRIVAPGSSLSRQAITLQLRRTHLFPGGVRIFVADSFSLLLTSSEYSLLDEDHVTLELDKSAMTFLDK